MELAGRYYNRVDVMRALLAEAARGQQSHPGGFLAGGSNAGTSSPFEAIAGSVDTPGDMT